MPLELCSYNNSLDKMVIVRCFGSNGFYLERVVFPFEILNFQAPSEAEIEVWCHSIGGPELVSTDSIENLMTAAPLAKASSADLLSKPSIVENESFSPKKCSTNVGNSAIFQVAQ